MPEMLFLRWRLGNGFPKDHITVDLIRLDLEGGSGLGVEI
jgi:hypothetical protein